jgi:hypothetical protein
LRLSSAQRQSGVRNIVSALTIRARVWVFRTAVSRYGSHVLAEAGDDAKAIGCFSKRPDKVGGHQALMAGFDSMHIYI